MNHKTLCRSLGALLLCLMPTAASAAQPTGGHDRAAREATGSVAARMAALVKSVGVARSGAPAGEKRLTIHTGKSDRPTTVTSPDETSQTTTQATKGMTWRTKSGRTWGVSKTMWTTTLRLPQAGPSLVDHTHTVNGVSLQLGKHVYTNYSGTNTGAHHATHSATEGTMVTNGTAVQNTTVTINRMYGKAAVRVETPQGTASSVVDARGAELEKAIGGALKDNVAKLRDIGTSNADTKPSSK